MKAFDLVIKDNFSPNGEFYYEIKFPVDLNPSAFGSEIAFYNKNHSLLYHNKKAIAHELNDPADVAIVRAIMNEQIAGYENRSPVDKKLRMAAWSKQGNMAHILEYFGREASYYHVFINLRSQYHIRAINAIDRQQEYISIDADTLTRIGIYRPDFDEDEVLDTLEELGLRKEEPLIKDPVNTNFFADLLPRNKWYK